MGQYAAIHKINTLSQNLQSDTDVAHCNFNAHQPILVILGTDVAKSKLSNAGCLTLLEILGI